jgi:hypothetical protein
MRNTTPLRLRVGGITQAAFNNYCTLYSFQRGAPSGRLLRLAVAYADGYSIPPVTVTADTPASPAVSAAAGVCFLTVESTHATTNSMQSGQLRCRLQNTTPLDAFTNQMKCRKYPAQLNNHEPFITARPMGRLVLAYRSEALRYLCSVL